MLVTQKTEMQTNLGKFEAMSAIVDSGTAVPVMNPNSWCRLRDEFCFCKLDGV